MKPFKPLDTIPRRLLGALAGYLVMLTLIVTAFTVISNERAEKFAWTTILTTEMARETGADEMALRPGALPPVRHFDAAVAPIPAEILAAGQGIHDDLKFDGHTYAVLLRGEGANARAVAVDASGIEEREHDLVQDVALTVAALMVLFGLAAAWGLQRALKPLGVMVDDIAKLDPSSREELNAYPAGATAELRTVVDAVNGYAQRNRQFIAREQQFVHMASHELRTPVAVLRNELELALSQPDRELMEARVRRAQAVTGSLEDLLNILLVLARDPQRVRALSEPVDLQQLAERQIADHGLLLREKELTVTLTGSDTVKVSAPRHLAEVAVANLIRNAIENSDRGEIRIEIDPAGAIRVSDPGHGLSPTEISALYARIARGQNDTQSGIGMQLLARICEHLGWQLEYRESSAGGTIAELRFRNEALHV